MLQLLKRQFFKYSMLLLIWWLFLEAAVVVASYYRVMCRPKCDNVLTTKQLSY